LNWQIKVIIYVRMSVVSGYSDFPRHEMTASRRAVFVIVELTSFRRHAARLAMSIHL